MVEMDKVKGYAIKAYRSTVTDTFDVGNYIPFNTDEKIMEFFACGEG